MCYVLRAGQVTRSAKTWKTCQLPNFTSDGSSTKKSHDKDSFCVHVQMDLSNCSIFPNPPRGETPARRRRRAGRKRRKKHPSQKQTENIFGTRVLISYVATMKYIDQCCRSRERRDIHLSFKLRRRCEADANKH